MENELKCEKPKNWLKEVVWYGAVTLFWLATAVFWFSFMYHWIF